MPSQRKGGCEVSMALFACLWHYEILFLGHVPDTILMKEVPCLTQLEVK